MSIEFLPSRMGTIVVEDVYIQTTKVGQFYYDPDINSFVFISESGKTEVLNEVVEVRAKSALIKCFEL